MIELNTLRKRDKSPVRNVFSVLYILYANEAVIDVKYNDRMFYIRMWTYGV